MWNYYPRHEMEHTPYVEEPIFETKVVPIAKLHEDDIRSPDPIKEEMKSKKYYYDDEY